LTLFALHTDLILEKGATLIDEGIHGALCITSRLSFFIKTLEEYFL